MSGKETFFKILNQEMVLSTGCTEPAAISYISSVAANEIKKLNDEVKEIKVLASKNILKNAMSAGLPNSSKVGVNYAAGIGALHGDPKNKLNVNNDVDIASYDKAEEMIKKGLITVEVAKVPNVLYIDVTIKGASHTARAVIADQHTNIILIEVDGKAIFENKENKSSDGKMEPKEIAEFLSLEKIWNFATKELDVEKDPIDIVRKSVEVNDAISKEGLKNNYGLQIGKTIYEDIKNNLQGDNVVSHAIARAAAGSDARMVGAPFAVVTNSGSGNQGITNTMPVLSLAEEMKVSEEIKYRALTLTNLTSIYIKSQFGTLSAFCGAAIASTGAACGITYLRGGDYDAYERTIQNMVGTVTGMLCDGAKPDCSLKIYAGLQAAFYASKLALKNIRVKSTEGIVCEKAEDSIKNLCTLSKKCSDNLDDNILYMMLHKEV